VNLEPRRIPGELKFSTTADQLKINIVDDGDVPIAPELGSETDYTMGMHETFVNQFAENIYGGERIIEDKLNRMFDSILGSLEEDGATEGAEDGNYIWLTAERPMEVRFFEGRMQTTIRGEQFRGSRTRLDITTNYNLKMQDLNILWQVPEYIVGVLFIPVTVMV